MGCPCRQQKFAGTAKAFPHECFKRNYSNYPGLFPPASSVGHRWQTVPSLGQTSNIPHRNVPRNTLEPQGIFHPQGPWAKRGVSTLGNPRPGNSLQGSSSQAMSGFGQGHCCAFGNSTGIILAPWLCSVESTADISKQTITHGMLSYGRRAEIPGHAK